MANRHVKSVKIGAGIFVLTVATYLPAIVGSFVGVKVSGYWAYAVYVNNFANFFVYLWIDDEFRRSLRC